MSALAAVLAFAGLFALFGALAVHGARMRACHRCDEEPAECGACPFADDPGIHEEVEFE
ncbi:MAG: hypothetical protein R3199_03250 [Gemmatimonadota bacterium]|nr:hypothetical protein [Gemmatimonadota bacterium]